MIENQHGGEVRKREKAQVQRKLEKASFLFLLCLLWHEKGIRGCNKREQAT